MKRTELIKEVAAQTGYTNAESSRLVDIVFGVIERELLQGREVNVPAIGIFRCKDRRATTGRNPRTGEEIQVAAKRSAMLRPAKALRDALNAQLVAADIAARRRA